MGKTGMTGNNSTERHGKFILGKPFCGKTNTCTSYCPPGLRPKVFYVILFYFI